MTQNGVEHIILCSRRFSIEDVFRHGKILAELSQPCLRVINSVLVGKREDNCGVSREICVRLEHVADDISCQLALVVWSQNASDHP